MESHPVADTSSSSNILHFPRSATAQDIERIKSAVSPENIRNLDSDRRDALMLLSKVIDRITDPETDFQGLVLATNCGDNTGIMYTASAIERARDTLGSLKFLEETILNESFLREV